MEKPLVVIEIKSEGLPEAQVDAFLMQIAQMLKRGQEIAREDGKEFTYEMTPEPDRSKFK